MDIWEANSAATAYKTHSCNITGSYAADCTSTGVCDQVGGDFNSYRMGDEDFYGPNKTVDTTRNLTVMTQLLTSDGTSSGILQVIKHKYMQGGIVISNSSASVSGIDPFNAIDDSYWNAENKAFNGAGRFEQRGGMKQIGEALGRGMVLVFSIWIDKSSRIL
ncbi:unnamed protein product [Sphagnum balticum]